MQTDVQIDAQTDTQTDEQLDAQVVAERGTDAQDDYYRVPASQAGSK